MSLRRTGCSLLSAMLLAAFPSPGGAAEGADEALALIIVYPGGPEAEGGAALIDQFVEHINRETGLPAGTISGRYFNDDQEAMAFAEETRDTFIMGSIGFFLANREGLSLVPLAARTLAAGDSDRFYLIVRQGRYRSLGELKGKTLGGNALFQNRQFLNTIVFDGNLKVEDHFALQPTRRPLSAVRKLIRDRLDAVLLDQVQFSSLRQLDQYRQVEVLYTSPPVPTLEFMAVDTALTRSHRESVIKGLTGICDSERGQEMCTLFGLSGFQRVQGGSLDAVIDKYGPAHP